MYCSLSFRLFSAFLGAQALLVQCFMPSSRTAAKLRIKDEKLPWHRKFQLSADVVKTVESTDIIDEWDVSRIRNFCIIAHIDHGKSTLADRLLENTQTVAQRDMKSQLLDSMDLERERGITIKLQAARMEYISKKDNKRYILNLIDTPGHVDFSYEVSRSLAACEGALLVVDASQGVEAQTLANVYLALENDLEIIPVLNKIDLPAADPDRVAEEVEETIGLDMTEAIHASAKSGIGIEDILESIVERVPPPNPPTKGPGSLAWKESKTASPTSMAALKEEDLPPPRALIFDSYYDAYRGVVVFFRVVDGCIKKGDKVTFMQSGTEHEVIEVGYMAPHEIKAHDNCIKTGSVGYLTAAIKQVEDAQVGDTITLAKYTKKQQKMKQQQQQQQTGEGNAEGEGDSFPIVKPLPGYAKANPMVYCGLFPVDADEYEGLRDALGRLKLNDAALSFEPETSQAMGFGFRCGFLGLLHMEIVQERLEREYDLDLIVTAPSVIYKVFMSDGEELTVDSPSKMPDPVQRKEVHEPYVRVEMLCPSEYVGPLIDLCQTRRGEQIDLKYLTPTRSSVVYDMPLAEVITNFFDEMKSRTKGYASMEYKLLDYRKNDLVKVDIRINGEEASPLSTIVHRDNAHAVGKALAVKLKDLIPRQQFKVPIQACIGIKPIASAHIPPLRKDVLAKCYGGDISRKKKLLQKQAKGKKRMKSMGKVNVPQEAFMAVLNLNKASKGGGGD